jgi:hypothetical protein
MEFDEDAGVSFQDLSSNSPHSPEDAMFTYNDADIDYVLSLLGIPWESTKTIPFGHLFPYLGFLWDLQACMVTIPPTKKREILRHDCEAGCKYHSHPGRCMKTLWKTLACLPCGPCWKSVPHKPGIYAQYLQ